MELFKLRDSQATYLAGLPETAMGYQVLALAPVQWSDANVFLALNSEFLLPASSRQQLVSGLKGLGELGSDSEEWPAHRVQLSDGPDGGIHVFSAPATRLAASLLDPELEWHDNAKDIMVPQPLVQSRTASVPEAYFRFSAFKKDRRIASDGSLLPGTYATTYNDLRMVPSGFAAVGRYALPHPHAARYLNVIVTVNSPSYVGTAVPNHGQAGGGVEVLFPKGAKSVSGRPWAIAEA